MSGEIRSLIQAAQRAEGSGEPEAAARHLRRAAELCDEAGKPSRAVQLLRHALRLRPDAADRAWLERLEAAAARQGAPLDPGPVHRLEDPGPPAEEGARRFPELVPAGEEARATPERTASRESPRFLEERRPQLASPELDAWCSFCCRPAGEVGRLVEGPAGAYVCGACLREAARLLELPPSPGTREHPVGPPGELPARRPWEHARASIAPPAPSVPPRPPTPGGPVPRTPDAAVCAAEDDEGLLLAHHTRALGGVEVALATGRRVVVLLGPQGSGRSTCLRALGPRLGGVELVAPFDALPATDLWLLDDAQELDASGWRILARALRAWPQARLVLTARAAAPLPTPSLTVESPGGGAPLWSNAELLAAAPGLPDALVALIDAVIPVTLPERRELVQLATALLAERCPRLEGPARLAARLVALTLSSGRGLHELESLVRRLPPDAVGLAPASRSRSPGTKVPRTSRKRRP